MIYICCLAEVPSHCERLRPSHVVSMLADDTFPETPSWVPEERHLRLRFHDIAEPLEGYMPPGEAHIERLLEFGESWQGERPLLVHCFAGVSRSTAAALILLAQANPGQEEALAKLLRRRAPHANPNRRMIALADDLLDRRGRLVEAAAAMGPGQPTLAGSLVSLPRLLREAAAE